MEWYTYIILLFHTNQQKINTCYYITQVCRCPDNTYNFKTDWDIFNRFRLRHFQVFSMIYCYLNTSNKRLGKTSKVEYAPKSREEALIWKLWYFLKVFVGYWKVIWCYLVLFSVTKKFFFKKKKICAKVTGLLHKPTCKKLNECLFLLRAPVKKLEYLVSSRGAYSNFFSREYNWNKKEKHLLC